jgi:hypothetical protein
MRTAVLLLLTVALSLAPVRAATPEEQYSQIEEKFLDAEGLAQAGKLQEALVEFDDCAVQLDQLKRVKPPWQLGLVINRLEDCHTRALLVRFQLGEQGDPLGSYPPRFAGTQSAPSAPATPSPPPPIQARPFNFNDLHPHPATRSYPWKSNIVTTVFWIGEGSTASGWNPHWVHDNGGADEQYEMSGYASGKHASTLNPFYVALPFNDLTHPELADGWVPKSWFKPLRYNGLSACKDRWIEIKNRAGRVCFAQWEDVGPIASDDAAYVFGSNPPSAGRGLNISPAVAKYLGIDATGLTSWRFVDDDDVMPGMWLRYDEQAVLFKALQQQKDTLRPATAPSH